MSKQLKAGQIIKLMPEMYKDNWKPDAHFGRLGYPGIMRDWMFKVIDQFNHASHGEMINVEAVSVLGAQGVITLRVEECVPAVMKRTIDYIVLDGTAQRGQMEREIARLNLERKQLATDGYKSGGRKMKANKSATDAAHAAIDALGKQSQVYLPKIKKTVSVSPDLLSKKEELEMFLAGEVFSYRQGLKKETGAKVKDVLNHKVKTIGGVHVEPNVYGKIYEKTLETFIDTVKKPNTKDNYLGIEIECLIKCSKTDLRKKFIEARLHKNVQIVGDGSIQSCQEGYTAIEIRVLVTEGELERVMTSISRILRSRFVDAYVNRSCGLHVHLDMRNRDVNASYSKLFNVQSLLRKAQPTARQVSQYCRPNKADTFKECERRDNERYSVINTNAYKAHTTLEIRVHEGSVSGAAIINWCRFLTGVLASEITSPVKTVAELEKMTTSIPRVGLDYISSRIAEYGDEEVA